MTEIRVHRPQMVLGIHLIVPFEITNPDNGMRSVFGRTTITDRGSRVYAETQWLDEDEEATTVIGHKLDPDDPRNDFDAVVTEIMRIADLMTHPPRPYLSLPMNTGDTDALCAIAHAWILNGRGEWG